MLVLSIFGQCIPLMSMPEVGALHVPRNELAAEMASRGFEMTDYFLQKFAVCEGAYRAVWVKHREAQRAEAAGE